MSDDNEHKTHILNMRDRELFPMNNISMILVSTWIQSIYLKWRISALHEIVRKEDKILQRN